MLFSSRFCLLTCTWSVRLSAQRWVKLCQALAFKIGVILELASCVVCDTMFFLKFQDLQCTEGENICSKFGTNSLGSKTSSEGRALESESVSLVRLFMVPCRKDNVFDEMDNVFDERVQSHRLVVMLCKTPCVCSIIILRCPKFLISKPTCIHRYKWETGDLDLRGRIEIE